MFRQAFVKEYLTILNSDGPSPLKLWKPKVKNGWIKRVWDPDLCTFAVEVRSENVSVCSMDTSVELGIDLPYIVFGLKNLNKYFTFQITVKDDFGLRRRLRFSNFETRTRVATFDCSVPLCLNAQQPWNLIRIDLRMLTKQVFNATYIETVAVSIHANCRVRRVYFCRVLLPDYELPMEYSVQTKTRTRTTRREVKPPTPTPADFTPAPPPTLRANDEEDSEVIELSSSFNESMKSEERSSLSNETWGSM